MAIVSGYRPTQVLEEQLLDHPNWKDEEVELKQESYIIVKESNNCFRLLWLNKKGEKISVPFWINTSTFQWCFRNGQSHISNRLDETISCIFKHFKKQDE